MAIKPSDEYPGQTLTSDPAYPQGKARNQLVVGDGVGTPFEAKWVNDVWGFLQALLDDAGITPSGDPDEVGASQYLAAIEAAAATLDGELEDLIDASADLDPKPTRSMILHASIFDALVLSTGADPWLAGVAAAGSGWRLRRGDNNGILMMPLSRVLPFGAELTSAQLMLTAGTHTTGGRFSLNAVQLDFQTPAISSHNENFAALTSGTGFQVVTLSVSPALTVQQTSSYYLVYHPTDLTAGADSIEGVRLVFNDPGPRNF